MGAEVWGTFAVNDHCRENAFAGEVLLFDRLVLPVPDDQIERTRWEQPDPANPKETWNPQRLDAIVRVLGSQKRPEKKGQLPLVWEAPWNRAKWDFEKSRSDVADKIARDGAFGATRYILAQNEPLPGVVEAVAAYPSASRCREELRPADNPPSDRTAANLLIALATPLLVPRGGEGSKFGPLRAAAELARDQEFRKARAEYHDWVRNFVAPLQTRSGARLGEIEIDRMSLELANERLHELKKAQSRILGQREARKRWKQVQYAVTIVAVGAGVSMALVNPFALVGVAVQLAGFVGWVAAERATEPPLPPLSGASLFLTVEQRLGWGGGPPHHFWDRLR